MSVESHLRPGSGKSASPNGTPGALVLGGAHGGLAVVRSLGRRGIPVWFITHDHPIASFSRYTERSVSWDGPDRDGAVEQLIDLARRHHLDGWVLFACGDQEVRLVAQHHEQLSAIFRLTTPPWRITRYAYDKHLTYEHADSIDIAYPRSYRPRDRIELAALPCQFPIVIKPTNRKTFNAFTRAKGWKANDRAELLEQYDRAAALVGEEGIVLQEFVPGGGSHQFSYAAIWDRGAPVASLVARRTRQYPIEFGYTSTFVESIENHEVEDIALQYLGSLKYSGIVELEFKFDDRDGRYKLLDFNARPWTWIALGETAGVDFPYLAWLVATGQPVERVRGRAGATWIHAARDLVAACQYLSTGVLTAGAYLKSYRLPVAFAAFAWDDPVPGLLELPLTTYRAFNRRIPFVTWVSNRIRAALSETYRVIWRTG